MDSIYITTSTHSYNGERLPCKTPPVKSDNLSYTLIHPWRSNLGFSALLHLQHADYRCWGIDHWPSYYDCSISWATEQWLTYQSDGAARLLKLSTFHIADTFVWIWFKDMNKQTTCKTNGIPISFCWTQYIQLLHCLTKLTFFHHQHIL